MRLLQLLRSIKRIARQQIETRNPCWLNIILATYTGRSVRTGYSLSC